MKVRALVCDDETLVRNELAYSLRRVEPETEIVECSSALDALAHLQQQRFDVLFLDVRMPRLSGLDAMSVISKLPDPPHVVFVSAHEDHAIAAFEVAALDYLLKPVSQHRLAMTLQRLQHAVSSRSAQPPRAAARLPVESASGTRFVALSEIRVVRADDRSVTVQLYDETARFRGSLAECTERLQGRRFLRVHRSFVVNLDRVAEVAPSFGGTYVVRMDDRARSHVPVSRTYVRAMRAALDI